MSNPISLNSILKSVIKNVIAFNDRSVDMKVTALKSDLATQINNKMAEIADNVGSLSSGLELPNGLIGTNGEVDDTAMNMWVAGLVQDSAIELGLIGEGGNVAIGPQPLPPGA